MKTPLTQEIDRLTKINAELVSALQECSDWFAGRADVIDGAGAEDPPSANAEMSMQMFCDAVLAKTATFKTCTHACDSCECHEGVVS